MNDSCSNSFNIRCGEIKIFWQIARTLKTGIHERLFNAMYKTLQLQSGEIK